MEGLVQDRVFDSRLSLKRRSLFASIGQIILVLAYTAACFSLVSKHLPIQITLAAIVLVALLRAKLSMDSRVFPALFACLALLSGILWSVTAVTILRIAGYHTFESLMFLFLCSGICAASLGSLIANLKLCRAFLAIILIPISLALVSEMKMDAALLSLICLTYLGFLSSQAKLFSSTFLDLQLLNEEKEADFRKLKALVDSVPGYISWVDREGNYLGANEKLLSYLGFSLRQFKKLKIGELDFDPDFVGNVSSFLNSDVYATGFEWVSKHVEHPRHMRTYLSKVSPGQGSDISAVICSFDVTEQHIMQEEMFKQQKSLASAEKWSALGELAGSIAHEINNPLAIVSGLVQRSLKKGYVTEGKGVESMEKVLKSCDRITRIVSSVKNLARFDESNDLESVSLSSVILQVQDLSTGFLTKSGVRFEIESEQEICVLGEETQLLQVFLNVLKNSCDAVESLPDRWVKLSFDLKEMGVVKIMFTDSGPGLDASKCEQAFNSFFTTKEVGKGTGLGLSICKKIVDRFNGRIYFVPDSKNTTLVIELNAYGEIANAA